MLVLTFPLRATFRTLSCLQAQRLLMSACNLLFSMKFPEGMGVVGNSLEVSRGVGGLPQIPEKGKSEGVVGSCMKLPLWWGMDIF